MKIRTKHVQNIITLLLGAKLRGLLALMPHPCQILQKYTTFGESNTHPLTFLKSPNNIDSNSLLGYTADSTTHKQTHHIKRPRKLKHVQEPRQSSPRKRRKLNDNSYI